MDIPLDIRLSSTLKSGVVYYFRDVREIASDKPHYYVVVNINPMTDEFLVLAIATSKIHETKQRIKRLDIPQKTLIFISSLEYPRFTKKTVIDCNRVISKTKEQLIQKFTNENDAEICSEFNATKNYRQNSCRDIGESSNSSKG